MESMKKHYLKSRFWKRKPDEEKKRWFMDNGSIFLKELIADCNGKSIPLRSFSSDQIFRATNNFNSSCFISGDALYKWYRGQIEDRSYMIKTFVEDGVKITGVLEFVKGLYENGKLDEVLDQTLMQDKTSGQKLQVEGCMVLALRCCEEKHEDRPKIIQVAKELKRPETGQYRSLLGSE